MKRGIYTCALGLACHFSGAVLFGCSGEVPLSIDGAETPLQDTKAGAAVPSEVATQQDSAKTIGDIALANGARFSISEVPGGPLAVGLLAAEGDVAEVAHRMTSVRDAVHLYEVFAPDAEVPRAVRTAVERLAAVQASLSQEQRTGTPSAEQLVIENAVDSLRVVDKEAPRDVQGFQAVCASDLVVESSIGGIYARRQVQCHTERTGNGSLTVTASRQGISTVRPYRGAIGLRWSWKNGANWTIGGTINVTEGNYQTWWVFGAPVGDFKFEVINATGDGYHWQLETADDNPVNPKSLAGNDWYQQACVCMKGFQRLDLTTEGCTSNQWVFDHNATTLCQAYQANDPVGQDLQQNGWLCAQVLDGHWERATFGSGCQGNADIRECIYEDNCRYRCTDKCRLK